MGETGLVSTLQGVPSKSTLKRGHRTIRYQPHSARRDSVRTGIRKSEPPHVGRYFSNRQTGAGDYPRDSSVMLCAELVVENLLSQHESVMNSLADFRGIGLVRDN